MKYYLMFGSVGRAYRSNEIILTRQSALGTRRWALGIEKRTVHMIGLNELLLIITSDMVAP